MFESETVFIVGAGASAEAGLPIGTGLTSKIASLLDLHVELGRVIRGDETVYNTLRQLVQSDQKYKDNKFIGSGQAVAEAMQLALSIDTFLESHASNEEFILLGKLGIVRSIQIEERESLLGPIKQNGLPRGIKELANTWYYSLARQLFTGVPVEEPERAFENVSFIVFNYDRCLQAFLAKALQVYFQIDEQAAMAILAEVKILHPYGSLGSIFPGQRQVPFAPANLNLLEAANRIKTFSESADSDVMETAKAWVNKAQTQVYLGFGFHEQNMELLSPSDAFLVGDVPFRYNAYATTYGLSASDEAVVKDQISYLRTGGPYDKEHSWINTIDGKCAALFSGYWRSLTN